LKWGILFFLTRSVLHPNKPKHDLTRKIAKADKSADKTLNMDVFIRRCDCLNVLAFKDIIARFCVWPVIHKPSLLLCCLGIALRANNP